MGHEQILKMLKALGNESRLCILEAIKAGQSACCGEKGDAAAAESEDSTSCCVEQIVKQFHMAQSTVSQHLKELYNAGLLKRHKKAQWVYYTVDAKRLKELEDYLHTVASGLVSGESKG